MAHAVKEKIEILDQLDDTFNKKGFNYWLLIPASLTVVTATGAFFLVRRVRKNKAA